MSPSQRFSFSAGFVAGVLAASVGTVFVARAERADPHAGVRGLAAALALVERHYVDEVSSRTLFEGAVEGVASRLDPYSTYLDREAFAEFERLTTGRFVGIGVEIEMRDGWLVIVAVFPGGPAERAGLLPGDRVLSIGDTVARDLRMSDAIDLVRGEAGTEVRMHVRREGVDAAVPIVAVRGAVVFESVESRFVEPGVLYVRIRAFQEDTAERFSRALDDAIRSSARGDGVRAVVLDLRANGGGLLQSAVRIADELMEEGVIVSTRARIRGASAEFTARRRGTRPAWPLAVLIDENSASASEVLAGALLDSGRALVVGENSFGKGTVQEIVPLPDGGALKLTIARFYSPSGRSIDGQGIAPQLEVVTEGAPAADDAVVRAAVDALAAAQAPARR